jgi:hypothetical protein
VTTAMELLQKDLESAREREQTAALEVARLEAAMAALQGAPGDFTNFRQANQFAGKGIVEAAKVLIREKGPMATGDIMREAMARGWTTTSTKPIAAFYSTLNGSRDFERIDGVWHLKSK